MNIVCSPSDTYIMQTGIMLKSLSINNYDIDINIYVIIDKSLNSKYKEQLTNIVKDNPKHNIIFIGFDNQILNKYNISFKNQHFRINTYYRLYLAEILPEDIDKVLFLDGDIIIEKNLKDLWNSDISNYAIGCVIEQEIDNIQMYNRLHYPHELGYFNAGVLLINLRYWRNHSLSKYFTDFMEKYPERLLYHDQDIMNYVLKDQKKYLPLKYNVQSAFYYKQDLLKIDLLKYGQQIEDAKKDPYIIHYSSGFKPWYEDCCHPLQTEFIKYKNMTEWKDTPLIKQYLPNRPVKTMIGDILRFLRIKKPVQKLRSKYYFNI